MKKLVIILIVTFLFVPALQATPVTITFNRITSNCTANVAGQFSVDVAAGGPGVVFTFHNVGSVLSSISEIYFYDGSLLAMYSITDTPPTVDFENLGANTNPNKLPGYKPDKDLLVVLSSTEAITPEPLNGINPGESLMIGYSLQTGKTYNDLLTDLASGQVVIGIHVKSIDCPYDDPAVESKSDSFITPEPATLALLGLGGLLLRKRK